MSAYSMLSYIIVPYEGDSLDSTNSGTVCLSYSQAEVQTALPVCIQSCDEFSLRGEIIIIQHDYQLKPRKAVNTVSTYIIRCFLCYQIPSQ